MSFKVEPSFAFCALLFLGAFFWFFVRECRRNLAFSLSLLLIYSLASKQVSMFFIDMHAVPIIESGAVSHYNGSSWLYLFYVAVIFSGVVLVTRALNDTCLKRHFADQPVYSFNPPTHQSIVAAFAILSVVIALNLANVASSQSLALPGQAADRFNYWKSFAGLRFLPDFFGILMLYVPAVATIGILNHSPKDHRLAWWLGAYLAIYFALLILYGQRFNGIMPGASIFLSFLIIRNVLQGGAIIDKRIAGISVLVLTFALVYGTISMSVRGLSATMGSSTIALAYRIFVLEGHPFWGAIELTKFGRPGEWPDLVHGLQLVMTNLGEPHLMRLYFEHGVHFANSLPTTLTLITSPAGVTALCFVYGVIFGAVCFLMSDVLVNGRLLMAFPVTYIFQIHLSISARGSLEQVLDAKYFFALTLALALFIVSRIAKPRASRPGLPKTALPVLHS